MHYVGLSRLRNSSTLHILNLNEKKMCQPKGPRGNGQTQKGNISALSSMLVQHQREENEDTVSQCKISPSSF